MLLGASTPVILSLLNTFVQWSMPDVPDDEKEVPGASWFDKRREKLGFFSTVFHVSAALVPSVSYFQNKLNNPIFNVHFQGPRGCGFRRQ